MTAESRDDPIRSLQQSYNPPPETPREEMWAAIHSRLEDAENGTVVSLNQRRPASPTGRAVSRWAVWSAAAAALLVLGIGIGRLSMNGRADVAATTSGQDGPAVETSGGEASDARRTPPTPAFRLAAVEHLARSESLLTMVRSDARSGRYDAALGDWAEELLTETRLLLDSPAAADPAIGALLEDLELILVQLARLQGSPGQDRNDEELDLITNGMDRQDVLLRLQAVAPARRPLVGA